MLSRIYNKFKSLDFYLKALLVTMPFSATLLVYLLSIGAADLIFSNWFITLISVPTLAANLLATPAYFGGITDMFRTRKYARPRRSKELIGTVIGLLTGIAVGIGLSVMHVTVPLASSLYAFANVLFTFRQINIFAGLGNRLGRVADKGSRPVSEKALVLGAGLFGFTLGVILFATCTAAMISVVGVTSFFSGGAAIPVWIAGIIFILTTSSALASSADYTSKGISFLRSKFIKEGFVTQTARERKFEYGGSLTGVTIGLIIGAVVLGAIIATNPFLLTGIVGAVAGILILTTCAGIIGSIFSRIGRLIDGIKRPPNPELEMRSSPLLMRKRLSDSDELDFGNSLRHRSSTASMRLSESDEGPGPLLQEPKPIPPPTWKERVGNEVQRLFSRLPHINLPKFTIGNQSSPKFGKVD